MSDLNTAAEANVVKATEAISKLSTSLQSEREKKEKLCSGISDDNTTFHSSISTSLTKFQDDLAVKSKIMDELALRTTQVHTQTIKLKHARLKIDELKYERALMKSCISDVNSLMSNLIEAHEPIQTITNHKHLADKLCPAFALLNRLEGVSEASVALK